jgi:hypothetical protein
VSVKSVTRVRITVTSGAALDARGST